MLNIILTDGDEIVDRKTVTQDEYEELQKKAAEATDGNWNWVQVV